MHWVEARVIYDATDHRLAGELIADLLMTFGLQGVVVEDPGVEPEIDWADGVSHGVEQRAICGYFPSGVETERRLLDLGTALDQRGATAHFTWHLERREMDEEEWSESWKRFFWPQRIGRRLVVKPTWRKWSTRRGDVLLELDPGMAFGTGTHPTTTLCLELLERMLRPGQSVLDLGTGSGILLLAAARLGAGRGVGLDQDPMATVIARRNLILNGVGTGSFAVLNGDLTAPLRGRFDLLLANILTGVVLRLLPELDRILTPGGRFICSGINSANRGQVLASMAANGLAAGIVSEREGWVAIAGGRRVCACSA